MSSVIRRPRQRGFEISISTWTRKNSPPTNSLGFSHGDTYLSVSPNSVVILESSKHIDNQCICTQNFNLVNLKYLDGVDPSNLYNMTACLSKVHGSLARTRSASDSSSNTNKSIWSPASRTLKSFLVLHRGLNVRPTTSTLRALLVRNLAAKTNSLFCKTHNNLPLRISCENIGIHSTSQKNLLKNKINTFRTQCCIYTWQKIVPFSTLA